MLLLTCRYPSGKKHMRIRVTSITDRKQPAQRSRVPITWPNFGSRMGKTLRKLCLVMRTARRVQARSPSSVSASPSMPK